jgi:protein-S-isoprenylcysteine O-methyltransferase Ste14
MFGRSKSSDPKIYLPEKVRERLEKEIEREKQRRVAVSKDIVINILVTLVSGAIILAVEYLSAGILTNIPQQVLNLVIAVVSLVIVLGLIVAVARFFRRRRLQQEELATARIKQDHSELFDAMKSSLTPLLKGRVQ